MTIFPDKVFSRCCNFRIEVERKFEKLDMNNFV